MNTFKLIALSSLWFVIGIPDPPIVWAQDSGVGIKVDADLNGQELAQQVTIYRDPWGIAHVDGADDPATIFGFIYAQAEDYFWQIEDSVIRSLGRYSEVHGPRSRGEDLLNRAFRIVPEAQADYANLDEGSRKICQAIAAALNHYLQTHPESKPRLITNFEPWHVIAFNRHIFLNFMLLTKSLPVEYMGKSDPSQPKPIAGSNAWAIGPSRTKSGSAILFCNPHQPQFGFGQMYEGHVRSGEGWEMSGATFLGGPIPAIGHNGHLGWTHTVNRPDNVDFWTVTFDDPDRPNHYRFGSGYREAETWTDSIKILQGGKLVEETETFRSTIHGPVVSKQSDTKFIAMNMAQLNETFVIRQQLKMAKSKDLDQFKDAMRMLDLNFFNTVYADRQGSIYFVYNGIIPRRDPQFDYTQKLDGSDSRNLWQGIHDFDDLPQIENPLSGWIQSCNSSPHTSTDSGGTAANDYPVYFANDGFEDNHRSKVSRHLLRQMDDQTLSSVVDRAFDTLMYWPLIHVPRYIKNLNQLAKRNPELASQVRPYLDHLHDWDFRNSHQCTQSTLVEEWYRLMYISIYPPETRMLDSMAGNIESQYQALVTAAKNLEQRHGAWKIPWGDVHRLQRHANVADLAAVPFSDRQPSLPCAGVPGGLGAVFTQYYTPSIFIPVLRETRKHYAVLGTTYIAVIEFSKDGVQGFSLTNFGSSSDPNSPHYFDQAKLHSEGRLRPALFDWNEIRQQAKLKYQPAVGRSGASQLPDR